MPFDYWMATAILAVAPVAVTAQEKSPLVDPANPAEGVPLFRYESAFRNYRKIPDERESPDGVWRAANAEMKNFGGHAGHIKTPSDSSSAASGDESQPASHGADHKTGGK